MLTVSTLAETYHHGELRPALVKAALDLLTEAGADALSLRAVARRAGVSAMAPYRHYVDKEALLAAVATHGFGGLRNALLLADREAEDQALTAQAVAYVRYALDNPALFRLMFGPERVGTHPDLAASGEAAYAVLADRVAADTPAGDGREARVLGCWSLVHGLALLFLDGKIALKTSAPAEEIVRRVAHAMLGVHGPIT